MEDSHVHKHYRDKIHAWVQEISQQCGLLLQIECQGFVIDVGNLDNDSLGFPGICRVLNYGWYLLGECCSSDLMAEDFSITESGSNAFWLAQN